jgi:hypothetical protein
MHDLQILINQAPGKAPPVTDLNHDGMVTRSISEGLSRWLS